MIRANQPIRAIIIIGVSIANRFARISSFVGNEIPLPPVYLNLASALRYLCFTRISWSVQSTGGLSGPILRDTAALSQRYPPSLRTMGLLVSRHGQLGAIPPPPCLSISPLESMRSEGAIPPTPQRGI